MSETPDTDKLEDADFHKYGDDEAAAQRLAQLEHHEATTVGLWATDRPELFKDHPHYGLLFEITSLPNAKVQATPPTSPKTKMETRSETSEKQTASLGSPLPRLVRRCTSHHFACDCREARFAELLEDTIRAHSTPDNGNYNECDKDPCMWCVEAKALIYHGHPEEVILPPNAIAVAPPTQDSNEETK
jgi:hypothetical protein